MRILPCVPLVLCACLAAAADKPPVAPKLPLGKDTTFVTGPLDSQGFIDYEAALNAEMGKGVTAEKNAAALLVQVFGPAPEGGDGLPLDYFKWLDVPVPPKEGDYLVGITSFVRDHLGLTGERLEAFFEEQGRVVQRPWAARDCAPMAEWLKANEKQLALAVEATKRPQYFNPLTSRRKPGEASNLIGSLLPTVQKCRELATALAARAMLKLNGGNLDDAWADLLACHRLGRLVSRGSTLIESLVGIAIGQIAHNSTLAVLEHPDLTSTRARACLKDIQNLPPLPPLADKVGVAERMMGLDALQLIRRTNGGGINGLAGILGGARDPVLPDEKRLLEMTDWTTVMQTMNKWYDRLADALRMTDRDARLKAYEKLEDDFKAVKGKLDDPEKAKELMRELAKEKDGKAIGKVLGEVLMGLLSPATQKVQQAHDRAAQVAANTEIALALAAYKKDTGKYPAKLQDLAPNYLATVPNDLFSGKGLIWKPTEKGYLFYSVGANGKDDGGRWYDDEPAGDDPGVRVPLKPLKPRK
ncbi:MAG: hypothetical protein ACKODX_13260 [Gemmata sp.]